MKSNPNDIETQREYKTYVKTLDKVINIAKMKHVQRLISNNEKNPRKLWGIINSKVGNKR